MESLESDTDEKRASLLSILSKERLLTFLRLLLART